MELRARIVQRPDLPRVVAFLTRHVDTALFLLNSLRRFGPDTTDHPLSGPCGLIEEAGEVVAVFRVTRRGDVLVQAADRDDLAQAIVQACLDGPAPLVTVIGESGVAARVWQTLRGAQALVPAYEALHDAYRRSTLDGPPRDAGRWAIRRLRPDEFDLWDTLHVGHMREEGAPVPAARDERFARNRHLIEAGWIWGAVGPDGLSGTVVINAVYEGFGQVAGLYVAPRHRRQGLGRALMQAVLRDGREALGLHTVILHVNVDNDAARALYESMAFTAHGRFAFFFGQTARP